MFLGQTLRQALCSGSHKSALKVGSYVEALGRNILPSSFSFVQNSVSCGCRPEFLVFLLAFLRFHHVTL
jgi:hypothetical protein